VTSTDSSYQQVRTTTTITVGEPATVKVTGPSTLKAHSRGAYSVTGSTVPNTGATVSKVTWAWGDGKTSTGESVTHSYAAAGTYTISIVVLDSTGVTTTATRSVKVS
jgi:PKD repeat protein